MPVGSPSGHWLSTASSANVSDPNSRALLVPVGSGTVDQAKVAFLFGGMPAGADPDSPSGRQALLSGLFDDEEDLEPQQTALYETVANQVADDDPPEVWETAQRLLSLGLDRQRVMRELVMAMVPQVIAAVADKQPYDLAAHKSALAALPLPSVQEVIAAMIAIVQAGQPLSSGELVARTETMLDIPPGQEPHRTFIEHVFDQAVEDEDLEFVTDDLVVEPSSFCARAVLTHRLTTSERDSGYLETAVDLVCFEQVEVVHGPGGVELEYRWLDDVGPVWQGPADWLQSYPAGTVFAVRSNQDGTDVFLETTTELGGEGAAPALDNAAVAAVRAAYDEWVEGVDLPISVKLLVLILLTEDEAFFSTPTAPLRDLLAAAGLEHRDDEVAHAPEIWRRADELQQHHRVMSRFEDAEEAEAAMSVVYLFNDGDWDNADRMEQALSLLRADESAAKIIAGELLGPELEEMSEIVAQAALATRFANGLLAFASSPTDIAVSRWLMALADERGGDVLGAEAQLRMAVSAFGEWQPAVDRLAWYSSDRGDAEEAARLWRSIGVAEDDPRLVEMEVEVLTRGPRPGRNDPCWCGSGRKYKTCHPGKAAPAPLPERVRWLAAKSVSYLKRHSAEAVPEIMSIAVARAGGDTSGEAIDRALSDPLTLDLVLNEGGWFARFLEDRGPLLPSDEALLAASWAMVDRTIFELLTVRRGAGMTVKDLRTAEELEVRERTFSNHASAGMLVCARAVPDGNEHQFLGGLFNVRTGTEAALLDLLDEADPEAIAAWVAALDRPPVLLTRENEPSVVCKAVIGVPDEQRARRVLDANYEAGSAGSWDELFELEPDEYIVRATMRLEGSRLTVETNSEERMDRVLRVLANEIPHLEVLVDERRPLGQSETGRSRQARPRDRCPGDKTTAALVEEEAAGQEDTLEGAVVLPPEALEQLQDRFERRWCDERVPALAGLTPRQAAADPSRREALERLLREFERANQAQPANAIGMRPARLREILGLS
jgi:SEC-C motif